MYKINFIGIDFNGYFIDLPEYALLDTGSSAMTFPIREIEKIR